MIWNIRNDCLMAATGVSWLVYSAKTRLEYKRETKREKKGQRQRWPLSRYKPRGGARVASVIDATSDGTDVPASARPTAM